MSIKHPLFYRTCRLLNKYIYATCSRCSAKLRFKKENPEDEEYKLVHITNKYQHVYKQKKNL